MCCVSRFYQLDFWPCLVSALGFSLAENVQRALSAKARDFTFTPGPEKDRLQM